MSMTKLQLIEVEKFITISKDCIVIFGDTTSVLTRSVISTLDNLSKIGVLDTEENLEAFAKYRIRFTPYIHVYKNCELVGTFTLPISKEEITKCLM